VRTAVVGADGFVGGALAAALDADRVVFRPARDASETEIGNAGALLGAAGVVVNASGMRVRPGLGEADYRRTHEEAVRSLVPRLAPGALLVHVSSASVLGRDPLAPPPNDEAGRPETFGCPAYAVAKRDAERAAREAAGARGIRLVVLRPAVLYGRERDGMFGTLASLAERGLLLRLLPASHRHHMCALPLFVEAVRAVASAGEALEAPVTLADPFVVTSAELTTLVSTIFRPAWTLPFPAGPAGALLRRLPRSGSPRLDLATWGEILSILALDTVYDAGDSFRLLGLDPSRFARERTWERLARGLAADA
jgi:nucleoside-diphosphate-sugar epimerase